MSPAVPDLIARLADLAGPDRQLDAAILEACGLTVVWRTHIADYRCRLPDSDRWIDAPRVTASVSACRALIEVVLPHFVVVSGIGSEYAAGALAPDHKGAVGAEFRDRWAGFPAQIDVRLAPGGGTHRECAALLTCVLRALGAQCGVAP